MADRPSKTELIAELALARRELTAHLGSVRRELDFGTKLKASVRRHVVPWLGGAALLGLLVTLRPRRRKTTKVKVAMPRWGKEPPEEKVVKAGVLLTVLKIAFDIARPMLTKWVTRQFTQYAENWRR